MASCPQVKVNPEITDVFGFVPVGEVPLRMLMKKYAVEVVVRMV